MSAVGRGIFGAGSGFRVGEHTAGGGGLIAVLGKFLASIDKIFIFAGGRWALGYHSMGFRHFPMVLGRSATRETTSTHHVYK